MGSGKRHFEECGSSEEDESEYPLRYYDDSNDSCEVEDEHDGHLAAPHFSAERLEQENSLDTVSFIDELAVGDENSSEENERVYTAEEWAAWEAGAHDSDGTARPAEHATSSAKHATCLAEHATRSLEYATCPAEHATRPAEHATCPAEHATGQSEHATCLAEHATRPAKHATGLREHATSSPEHATGQSEHATSQPGHATGSVKHAPCPAEQATRLAQHATRSAQHATGGSQQLESGSDSDSAHVSATDSGITHVSATDSDTTHVSATDSDTTHVSATDSDTTHVSDTNSDTTHVSPTDSDTTHVSVSTNATMYVSATEHGSGEEHECNALVDEAATALSSHPIEDALKCKRVQLDGGVRWKANTRTGTLLAHTLSAVRDEEGPLLLVFYAYLRGHRVKVLVDSGASDNFISAECARTCDLTVRSGTPMKVTLADGSVKTAGEVAYTKFTAHTAAGVNYCEKRMALRVLPLGIQVDVVLGGKWLRSLSPVTLDYAGHGSVSFNTRANGGGQQRVTLAGCSPGMGQGKAQGAGLIDEPSRLPTAVEVPPPHTPVEKEEPRQDTRDAPVSSTWKQRFDAFFEKYLDTLCAALPEASKLRRTEEDKARIDRKPDAEGGPPCRRPYKMTAEELRQLRERIEQLMKKGYIRPSSSPYAAPCLVVPKPGDPKTLRLVVDYRQLNQQTVRDRYPLPDTQLIFDEMQGAAFFSSFDAVDGFWQVSMAEEDVEKTAFTTQMGAYEWLVMPQGLQNSPSQYQRRMQRALGHLPFVRIFIDDVVVFSRTVEEHDDHVLRTGRAEDGPKEFFIWGRTSSTEDIFTAKDANLSMTSGENSSWAFDELKTALSSAPVLALPDMKAAADGSAPFLVQTDASGVALGGVLMQDTGDGMRAIAYDSRQFSAAEQNYHTGERELCALHHCTTVTWRHYLFSSDFRLQGDHRPLEWLMSPGRELSRRQARWYMDLVEVGVPRMEYVKGALLLVPDALSRRPDYVTKDPRDGLKEAGVVDKETDLPKDPLSVLDVEEIFEDHPPPPVPGWVATMESWMDGVETLQVAERALGSLLQAGSAPWHATGSAEHATCQSEHATCRAEHATRLAEHATRPAEHATRLPEHATSSPEHAACLAEHATSRPEHATGSAKHATCPAEHATRPAEHATGQPEHATGSAKHATCPAEHATRPAEHATCLAEHATSSAKHATCLAEHATRPAEHATSSAKHATCPAEHATCLAEHATCPVEHATSSAKHAACLAEHATRPAEHATSWLEHATCPAEHATRPAEHATCNMLPGEQLQ
ncbi:hypothetical protein CYMTET_20755 [Cymbomonas tetramitiformis]|uniref:RNA-directed DNA polymerase n=1 Tax=Cymbomonas tetramitiformis TaxID=36881 RepID=A0AAE0L3X8_9CHLO|nr:hypothetical protein CYMTET_20755 [Cymbomonas tetramitiformis]